MVLVSHTHKLIFLKTRKTAGTSVEMLLEAATGLGPDPAIESRASHVSEIGAIGFRMLPKDRISDQDKLWRPHMTARKLRQVLGREIWHSYFKVACVRNPFDRLISLFHWQQRFAAPNERNETFSGFSSFLTGKWHDDRNVVMIDDHFVPDALLRYECLSADLKDLAALTGIPMKADALPVTKNQRHHRLGQIAEYYTHDLVQLVRDRMPWPFQYAGYTPDLAPSRVGVCK